MESDEVFKCTLCSYKDSRRDNFNRHKREKHLKILSQCNLCGKKMTATSISRHRKKACMNGVRPIVASTSSFDTNDSTYVVNSVEHQIQTVVKVDTLSNGRTVISSEEIQLNGITYVLVPKHNSYSNVTNGVPESSCESLKTIENVGVEEPNESEFNSNGIMDF